MHKIAQNYHHEKLKLPSSREKIFFNIVRTKYKNTQQNNWIYFIHKIHSTLKLERFRPKGVSRKFSRGEATEKKDQKLAKIALFASSRAGEQRKKNEK